MLSFCKTFLVFSQKVCQCGAFMFGIVVWFKYLFIDVAGGRIGARYSNFTVSPLGDATGTVTLKCLVDATVFVSPSNSFCTWWLIFMKFGMHVASFENPALWVSEPVSLESQMSSSMPKWKKIFAGQPYCYCKFCTKLVFPLHCIAVMGEVFRIRSGRPRGLPSLPYIGHRHSFPG
jgi:hypothetical protein